MTSPGVWYEICVSVDGQVREVIVRGSRTEAIQTRDRLKSQWPQAQMIFIRQHRQGSFRVLHKLTWKKT